MEDIKERVAAVVAEFGYDVTVEDFYLEMDSVSYINIIVGLETEFDITFPDEALGENIFISMDNCYAMIEKLVSEQA